MEPDTQTSHDLPEVTKLVVHRARYLCLFLSRSVEYPYLLGGHTANKGAPFGFLEHDQQVIGGRQKPLLIHLPDSQSSAGRGFSSSYLLAPPLLPPGPSCVRLPRLCNGHQICWQTTKMLLVLLSILHPLGVPSEPNMPGRTLLWSLTHCAHVSAAPRVQVITICPLHNFRTSLGESDNAKRNPADQRLSYCSVNQKAILPYMSYSKFICHLLLSSTAMSFNGYAMDF